MEDKRYLLVLVTIVITSIKWQSLVAMPTPNSVDVFYDGMEKLATVTDPNIAYDISKEMKECFFGVEISNSGVFLPNDFRFFDVDKNNISHNDGKLNSSTYVNRLKEYLYQSRIMKVSCSIHQTELVGDQPEFSKGKLSSSSCIVATFVQKTYSLNGISKSFNDTVYTDFSSGKINVIKNGNGQGEININTLKVKAALAYRSRRYEEAYNCYEQILSLEPTDGDACYRLGLMTYYRQGCNFSKKIARQKGKEYILQARRYGKYPISEKAENVLHNWTYTIL